MGGNPWNYCGPRWPCLLEVPLPQRRLDRCLLGSNSTSQLVSTSGFEHCPWRSSHLFPIHVRLGLSNRNFSDLWLLLDSLPRSFASRSDPLHLLHHRHWRIGRSLCPNLVHGRNDWNDLWAACRSLGRLTKRDLRRHRNGSRLCRCRTRPHDSGPHHR